MIKRICDHCGTVCADDMSIDRKDKRRNAVMLIKMQPTSEDEFWFERRDDIFDLCPFCMEKLQKWLNGGENREID